MIFATARIPRLPCMLLAMLPWMSQAAEEPILRLADAIKRGESAVHYALRRNSLRGDPFVRAAPAEADNSVVEVLEILPDHGGSLTAADAHGATALTEALDNNKIDKARFLAEHGATPKGMGEPGPKLLLAARQFHDRAMPPDDYAFLIDMLAGLTHEIDRRDADGMTRCRTI